MDKRHKTNTKARSLHRVRIIKGHLGSIEKMLEQNRYCIDIVHQSRAIQKALKQLQRMLDSAINKFNYEQAIGIKEQIRKLRSQ